MVLGFAGPRVGAAASPAPGDRVARAEAYYYDGVRRIQELATTYPPVPAAPETAVREYVWGPAYVDELVAQLAADGGPSSPAVWFYLLDANFNVVGLTDAAGAMAEQYTCEPYGGVALRDAAPSGPLPTSTAGHQGLFCYCLDGPASAPALSPAAQGLYYNRNRWYSPALGRFTSRDPLSSGLPEVSQALQRSADAKRLRCDPLEFYGQGCNLYEYLGSNSIVRVDPPGTWSCPEIVVTLGINTGLGALGGGLGGLFAPADDGKTRLHNFLYGMLTGGLTGAAATGGVWVGGLGGFLAHGGVALIRGQSWPQIGISSVFGAFGGAFGGALSVDELKDLFLPMFTAQFDVTIVSNMVTYTWDHW